MNWVTYLCISLLAMLVLYLTLGRAYIQVRRNEKNRRECMGKVWGTFFDPVTGGSENFLCPVYDTYKVMAPPGKGYETPAKSKEAPRGFYLLVTATPKEVEGIATGNPNPVVAYKGKVTVRDIWPPNKPGKEQVIIEHGYWVRGQPSALNPFTDFLPINTDRIVEALTESKHAEALVAHMRYEFEGLMRIGDDIAAAAKSAKFAALAGVVVGVLIVISLGVNIYFSTSLGGDIGDIAKALGIK